MSARLATTVLLLLGSLNSGATDVAPYVDPILDFPSVVFEKNQLERTGVLNPLQVAQLRETVAILRRNPTMRISLAGYADSTEGPELECQVISQQRARLVFEWLATQGVTVQIKGYKGYGCTHPVDFSDTEAQRRRNRRVELIVE